MFAKNKYTILKSLCLSFFLLISVVGFSQSKQIVIETGKSQGDVIEVLDGLSKDMQVVLEGARSVRNGQEVQILK